MEREAPGMTEAGSSPQGTGALKPSNKEPPSIRDPYPPPRPGNGPLWGIMSTSGSRESEVGGVEM